MTDIRVLIPADVRQVARHGTQHDLNRQIPQEVLRDLDPAGYNVLKLILPYHERGIIDDPAHHRVLALFKVNGEYDPVEMYVDVLTSDWETFQEA